MSHHDNHNDKHEFGNLHHILSKGMSRKTLVTLLALTIITVVASRIDLGSSWNFILAMAIASVKALIVTLFFMGLRYDSNENRAIFYSSIFFLFSFIALTATDIFTRNPDWQVGKQDVFLATKASGGPDIKKPWEASPEILAHGKKLFDVNCAVCHGAEGLGNGPGSALPIKPRNFHEATGWKNIRRASDLHNMLEKGVPPYMPAYGQLGSIDRWGLAQYVLSFGPKPEAEDAKSLAAAGVLDPTKDDGGVATGPKHRQIPIDFAVERYIQSAK